MAGPSIADTVRTFLDAHHLAAPDTRIVVAVSGGPDSLCLLHVLAHLRAVRGLKLHIAHLNHMLRGKSAADDAAFVAEIARQWQIPATLEEQDVAALAGTRRQNIYAVGRAARYNLFARVAQQFEAHAVAVAHTASDQAETVLLNLLRGAGPAGLGGIRPVAEWADWAGIGGMPALNGSALLIRPLLDIPREAIEAYCGDHRLTPREDASNADTRHTRSRIRHELLPALIEYNPRIVETLARTADLCAEEHRALESQLDAYWRQSVSSSGGILVVDGHAWRAMPAPYQRLLLRRAYRLLGGAQTLRHNRVEAARQAVEQGAGRVIEFPEGIVVHTRHGGTFTLGPAASDDQATGEQGEQVLAIPGEVVTPHGWRVLAETHDSAQSPGGAWEIWLRREAVTYPLAVRSRRAGDRIALAGGQGRRRLQDVFVDAHVPVAMRSGWPVITSGGNVVWVAGLQHDPQCIAAPGDTHVVRLVAEPPPVNTPQTDAGSA